MSCILRVWGKDFDVDSCKLESELKVIKIWRKGQPKYSNNPNSSLNKSSGISIEMSSAVFSELGKQMTEAVSFCKKHKKAIANLISQNGVQGADADFGAEIYPPGWSSFNFDPELLLILGNLGVSLELSVYPTDNEDDSEK